MADFLPDLKQYEKISLVGLPGSGKTYRGGLLATELGLPFYDLDKYIESQAGLSPSDIINQNGEAYFRSLEQIALKEILQKDKFVLATGGGTPCFFDNMDMLIANSYTIWLNPSLETIAQRLLPDLSNRPLLDPNKYPDLHERLIQLAAERFPYYNKASFELKD